MYWTQTHFQLLLYADNLDIPTKIEYVPIFIQSLLSISTNIHNKDTRELRQLLKNNTASFDIGAERLKIDYSISFANS